MKWISKNWLILSIFLAIVIFIIIFKINEGDYDLFTFPFISEVWGNAADWSMVIVTIVTACYLIYSFNEQKQTNLLQKEEMRINNLPSFSLTKVMDPSQIPYALNLKIIKNDVFNFTIIVEKAIVYDYKEEQNYFEGDEILITLDLLVLIKKHVNSITLGTIYFSDNLQNKYEQKILFSNKRSYHLSTPKIIN